MKKMMLFLMILTICLQASDLKNGLGFGAGPISGVGFSYRNHPTDKFAWQINFGAISEKYDQDWYSTTGKEYMPIDSYDWQYIEGLTQEFSDHDRETNGNIGVTIYRYINKRPRSGFYLLAGATYYFTKETVKYHIYTPERIDDEYVHWVKSESGTSIRYDYHWYYGLGMGFEFFFFENIRLAVELPVSISSDGNLYMYIPQVGLHYMF